MIRPQWFIFLLFYFWTSCAGSVKVSSQGCSDAPGAFYNEENHFQPTIKIEEKIWSGTGSEEGGKLIYLRDLLESEGIECKKLKTVRVEMGQTLFDMLFGLVPFINRNTVIVEAEVF